MKTVMQEELEGACMNQASGCGNTGVQSGWREEEKTGRAKGGSIKRGRKISGCVAGG